jgi:hypothetical protein
MGLTCKNENGQYFIRSGNSWHPAPKRITTLEELQKYFNCNDIEVIRTGGKSMRTLEILSYDGASITIKNDTGTMEQIYLPLRTKQEMIDYLMQEETKKGFNQVVIKVNSSENDNYSLPDPPPPPKEKIIISAQR